jgi:hypothetical protein
VTASLQPLSHSTHLRWKHCKGRGIGGSALLDDLNGQICNRFVFLLQPFRIGQHRKRRLFFTEGEFGAQTIKDMIGPQRRAIFPSFADSALVLFGEFRSVWRLSQDGTNPKSRSCYE